MVLLPWKLCFTRITIEWMNESRVNDLKLLCIFFFFKVQLYGVFMENYFCVEKSKNENEKNYYH